MHNNISECCADEGETNADDCAQGTSVDSGRTVVDHVVSRNESCLGINPRLLDFTVQSVSQQTTNVLL